MSINVVNRTEKDNELSILDLKFKYNQEKVSLNLTVTVFIVLNKLIMRFENAFILNKSGII